jgi:tRNA threonylcarbamoyladenosine biosynthesis protein TsaE
MEIKLKIHDLREMDELARHISRFLKPGFIIGLDGDLGSGKTTFTQFLAKHMGIKDNVNSPTFTLLKIYPHRLPLYHMDVYRLEQIGYDYELDEFIFGNGVAVIEWYPYIKKMLPGEMLEMIIRAVSETEREITVKGGGEYVRVIEDLGHRYSH